MTFPEWLRANPRMVIHAGGLSRRLPAYAAAGKVFTPMPVWRWSRGQRLDQSLLDLQADFSARVFERAPAGIVAGVASGDVLLRCPEIPELPPGDVVALGLWVSSERASRHGVFFCDRRPPHTLRFFLQKPSPARIEEQAQNRLFLIDSGFWLLSERALRALFAKCGLDFDQPEGDPQPHELYADFGLALGPESPVSDPVVNALEVAVCPLPEAGFHHFGSGRDLISSTLELQNLVVDQRQHGATSCRHPSVFIQNAKVAARLWSSQANIWIENSAVGSRWTLSRDHILTGIPENDWELSLPPGACLDLVPLADGRLVPRVYGMDDEFRGRMGDDSTPWLGSPVTRWLAERGLDWATSGLDPDGDVFDAPLFPALPADALAGEFIQWLIGEGPEEAPASGDALNLPANGHTASEPMPAGDQDWPRLWRESERFSARQLGDTADLPRVYAQRQAFRLHAIPRLIANHARSAFFRLDLERLATSCKELPDIPDAAATAPSPLARAQAHAFHAEWLARRGADEAQVEARREEAFRAVRETVIEALGAVPVEPVRNLLPDQIVWARSPVRLDLGGGWTDTPPFCFLAGARVTNLAVDLNGQPPIQVFVRGTDEPVLRLRSIDLGSEVCITTRSELAAYTDVHDPFALGKGALALAGFLPPHGGQAYRTLAEQLADFGGGLDISLLAAVPKGSGLGTSSILGATLLGALSEVCGLGWNQTDLVGRTLVLEQLLTTGGGWQDQAGGIFPGAKFLVTDATPDQAPVVRWLPERVFAEHSQSILLYYTGITRVAKGILGQVVRHVLLNSNPHLRVIGEIGQAAELAAEAIQRGSYEQLGRVVDWSRELNSQLDPGSYPPNVKGILDPLRNWLIGAKLLGAGGGGYVLMFAKDPDAAQRIRCHLDCKPPCPGARFVNLSLSGSGLQITRS
jgi:galactokinase/mevalonate kinase-like predicted kinase